MFRFEIVILSCFLITVCQLKDKPVRAQSVEVQLPPGVYIPCEGELGLLIGLRGDMGPTRRGPLVNFNLKCNGTLTGDSRWLHYKNAVLDCPGGVKLLYEMETTSITSIAMGQECQMTPVIHVLKHPGCIPKAIPSFACIGKCSSYVQVSGSKIWQMERTCNCCQESGEREATVVLLCPKAKNEDRRLRKITTKAPLECMCRPCGSIDESAIVPQEVAGYADEGPLYNHFRKTL